MNRLVLKKIYLFHCNFKLHRFDVYRLVIKLNFLRNFKLFVTENLPELGKTLMVSNLNNFTILPIKLF